MVESRKVLECQKCGYRWIPRKVIVRRCASKKCQSIYFDRPNGEPYEFISRVGIPESVEE